jgi:hypothetical protein
MTRRANSPSRRVIELVDSLSVRESKPSAFGPKRWSCYLTLSAKSHPRGKEKKTSVTTNSLRRLPSSPIIRRSSDPSSLQRLETMNSTDSTNTSNVQPLRATGTSIFSRVACWFDRFHLPRYRTKFKVTPNSHARQRLTRARPRGGHSKKSSLSRGIGEAAPREELVPTGS